MKILSLLMARLGYVRLKDYGYALTPNGRIVEVQTVEDDRFAPPPWQPVAWQSAVSLLPPAPSKPPVPRPLAPPPDPVGAEEAEPVPLFAAPAAVETPAPGEHDYGIEIDEEEPEEEEWEWKMALARARETAEKEKKEKDKKAVRPAPSSSFRTSSLPLAAPPSRSRVVQLKPMSKIARPEPRSSIGKPAAARVEPPISRVEPRPATEPPVARSAPRTAPPKAPPPGRTARMAAVRPAEPPPAPEPKSQARATLEKSVSRVFSPSTPAAGKLRPLPRMARGTEAPDRGSARPTRPQFAQGSTRLPVARDPSHDVTATDITAVDRAEVSMREDEDTRVNVVVAPPSADITLDITLDPEEKTTVDPKPNGVPVVSVSEGSPLPRLTARLRRVSSPN